MCSKCEAFVIGERVSVLWGFFCTFSLSSRLIARASCSCSSSSPLVDGRACSRSGASRGEEEEATGIEKEQRGVGFREKKGSHRMEEEI